MPKNLLRQNEDLFSRKFSDFAGLIKKKEKGFDCFCLVYLRLLRTSAAAATAIMTIAAAMAIRVVVGIPLFGG